MIQKIKIVLNIKLTLNIMLGVYFTNINGAEIITGINKVYSQNRVLKKDQLSEMNRISNPSYIDTSNNQPGKPFKLLVIGNSLTSHGIAENIGWTHRSGMAATKIGNDFAHLLLNKIVGLLPNRDVHLRITNFADFERNFLTFDFGALDSLVGYNPDIIVFQLGENVSFNQINTPPLFEKKYMDLINCFKRGNHPLIICTTPFFPSLEKNEIIERVALTTKSFLADLSHLPLLDKENYAKDETNYLGNRNDWKNDGIGIHPGDYGMRNIAQQLFIIINAEIDKRP